LVLKHDYPKSFEDKRRRILGGCDGGERLGPKEQAKRSVRGF